MSRLESSLPEFFYRIISEVKNRDWWRFVRILGLPEHDIDDISYECDDLVERKYQMLTRWKSYFGYKQDEQTVIQCLLKAKEEVLGQSNTEFLNRNLSGGLLENRKIAMLFYGTMKAIAREKRKPFVTLKLQVPEHEMSSIQADYDRDVDEQCYQMFLSWKRRNNFHRYEHLVYPLKKFQDEFLNVGQSGPVNPASGDVQNRGGAGSSAQPFDGEPPSPGVRRPAAPVSDVQESGSFSFPEGNAT